MPGIILTYAPLSILVPLFACLLNYKRHTGALKIVSWYVYATAIIQAASYILWCYKQNNLPLLHLYTPVEFAFVTLLYSKQFTGGKALSYLWIVCFVFVLASILSSLFVQGIFTYPSYIRGLEAVIIIVYSLCYYYRLLDRLNVVYLDQDPLFWINTAFFLYFSGALFLFIVTDSILHTTNETIRMIWSIHAIWVLLSYILIAVGLWKKQTA